MERNLFRYILIHSKTDQIVIFIIALISQLFYFVSLDLPKTIINVIQGKDFISPDARKRVLDWSFEPPEFLRNMGLPDEISVFRGFELDQLAYLWMLSSIFLVLVFINGGFKYLINIMKGRLGERMLRRLRFELVDRVLRFPLTYLRRMKQAEIATMVKDEVEPLGGFIGDAIVQPVYLGGQALTALVFIMVQNIWLGLLALAIVLAQAFIIPKLRVRILMLGRERQLTARQLAGRVAELVDGAIEVHAHDASNYERADIADRLGLIYRIRFEIYQRKFAVKFLNNFLAQLTPFLFYLIGGYFALRGGGIDVGGLVAALIAYKDLPGPIKELIDWDQQRTDVQIKYDQVIEQFAPDQLLEPKLQAPDAQVPFSVHGTLNVSNLVVIEDGRARILDGANFSVELPRRVAVVGPSGGGKEALGLALARLILPTAGRVFMGDLDWADLPEAVTGRRMSYVPQDAFIFPGSVRDNLLYGVKHRPLRSRPRDPRAEAARAKAIAEARRAGNPDFDPEADWISYEELGISGPEEIDKCLIAALRRVDMEEEVYHFGLVGTINPEREPDLARRVLEARAMLLKQLAQSDLGRLVEPFDPNRYNQNASLAENLLFGTPVGPAFEPDRLPENPYMAEVIRAAGIGPDLMAIGLKIAETMVELFADLPPGHPFFEQFSFISAESLPEYQAILQRIAKQGVNNLDRSDRTKLLSLPFKYVEARHRLGLIDPEREQRLIAARRLFARNLPRDLAGTVEFFDPAQYNAASTLSDNILFGRLVYGQAQAASRIGALITEVLDATGLRSAATAIGLGFQVGVAGKRLSASQRQKLALARALLKRPDFLVIGEATAVMDGPTQNRVMSAVLSEFEGRALFWVLHRASLARQFEHVLVVSGGRVVEHGPPHTLDRPDSSFTLLARED
ncbi:MAG TPA: ABC transporter ATP-binding protein/permease [Alphaproteobacteria bacterium]|nr:ABC transporter ATP-binding protein/permease [Alphaproteobacteria bacterium]